MHLLLKQGFITVNKGCQYSTRGAQIKSYYAVYCVAKPVIIKIDFLMNGNFF